MSELQSSNRWGTSARWQQCVRMLAVWLTILAFMPALVQAETAISVGPSRITADQPLTPGNSYDLPIYTVTNGSENSLLVKVTPSSFRDKERTLPPPEWFRIEPDHFVLQSGEAKPLLVQAIMPPDAPLGSYRVWFRFHGEPEAAAGIVMATDVEVSFLFDVCPPSPLARVTPWGGPVLLVLALGALWWAVRRRRRIPTEPKSG